MIAERPFQNSDAFTEHRGRKRSGDADDDCPDEHRVRIGQTEKLFGARAQFEQE